jgi:RimJ/RimL family protein N-acetyltransferase
MILPEVITTSGVELPLWDLATVTALRIGDRLPTWHPDFPQITDEAAANHWAEGDPWSPRSIVVRGWVVGSIGFHAPPAAAADGVLEAEVGYGLVPSGRGRGIVPEALGAVLMLTDAADVRVRASIAPDNRASMRVAAKLGFTEIRGADDQGELVLVRPLRPAGPADG